MNHTPRSLHPVYGILLRTLLLFLLGIFFLGMANAQNKRPVLEQAANGPVNDPVDTSRWVRGACIPNNSHYLRGHYMPYRAVIPSVPLSGASSIDIVFTVVQNGGLLSVDFLTSYDAGIPHEAAFGHPAEFIDPKSGVEGTFPPKTTFPVPAPPNEFGYDFAGAFASFTARFGQQVMSIWNGTIQSIEFRGYSGQPHSHLTARYTVTFAPNSLPVILAWGGHIASDEDYGAGNTAGKGKTELLRLSGAANEQDALTGAAQAEISAIANADFGGMSCSFSVDGGKPINPTRIIKGVVPTEATPGATSIKIYPNPSRGTLAVDLPTKEGGYDIYLTDISGRTVRQWKGLQERQLKVSALRPGIYLLDIRQPGTGKRVIEKLTVQ
jgi:hypothetical protein